MLAASRISAVARVHQHIYQSDGTKSFGCLGYLGRLCDDLSRIMGQRGRIVVEGAEADLPVEAIPPIGLAVNELVTNAWKYGAGRVLVTFEQATDGDYLLSVSDDGEGLPASFDPETGTGLGMKVVRMVARQLGGTLGVEPMGPLGGATITIRFPNVQ